MSLVVSLKTLVNMQSMATTPSDGRPVGWPSRLAKARLHFVTGKGGTGKSTVAAALALTLAGCGTDSAPPARPSAAATAAATSTVVAYVRAITAGTVADACALLTDAARAQIRREGHRSCTAYIQVIRRSLPRSQALRAVSVRDFTRSIAAAQAIGTDTQLRFIGDGLPEQGLPMVRVHGRWQLAAAF